MKLNLHLNVAGTLEVYAFLDYDCVHAIPARFENGDKCDGSEIWASVHTMPEQFENGTKFEGKKLVARL